MINKTEEEIMINWQGDVSKPLVTIRCLAYNHEKYIEQCLDGFLIQKTDFPFEIVIHDDASTDRTAEIIRQYEKKYPRILKPIYETENQYSKHDGSITQIILPFIKGKYIALCEGDDYWIDEHKLQKQISFLEKHNDYSMVFSAAYYVEDEQIIKTDIHSSTECDFCAEDIIRGGGLFCATASLCFNTDDYLHEYDFQKHADIGDFPLQIALSLRGKVHYFPDIMSVYRVGRANTNSWTNITYGDNNKKIQHFNTEIAWLELLDKETNYQYTTVIAYRIWLMSLYLYKENALTFISLQNRTNELCKQDRYTAKKRNYKAALKKILKSRPQMFNVIMRLKNRR